MKRFLFAILLLGGVMTAKAGVEIPYTEIPYNVNYHWGIINVNIAHGNVEIQSDGNRFYGTLDGVSIPWEGHVIMVSDTLDFNPVATGDLRSEKINYQAGWYRRPKANYYRSKNYDSSNPSQFKNIAGGGTYDASHDTMEAITITSDMLGMFYYAQEIDFDSLQQGDQITIPIEGPYAKNVVITYQGEGNFSGESKEYATYDCEFEYTYDNEPSGYEVTMKIGKENRLPLFISASVPVGHVEMLYTGDDTY